MNLTVSPRINNLNTHNNKNLELKKIAFGVKIPTVEIFDLFNVDRLTLRECETLVETIEARATVIENNYKGTKVGILQFAPDSKWAVNDHSENISNTSFSRNGKELLSDLQAAADGMFKKMEEYINTKQA